MQICNGGMFLTVDDIWRSELVEGRGTASRHLLPHASFLGFQGTLLQTADTGDLSREWAESEAERMDTRRKKIKQRAIFREAREAVAHARRKGKLRGKLRDYPFSDYRWSEFTRNGRALMRVVDKERATELANLWEANPEGFPYFTAFVEGFVYSQYYAAIEHNGRLDGNEQADYEQLAHPSLGRRWQVVSNDGLAFFRGNACDTLWKPRGKRMESAASFVQVAGNVRVLSGKA